MERCLLHTGNLTAVATVRIFGKSVSKLIEQSQQQVEGKTIIFKSDELIIKIPELHFRFVIGQI